MSLNRRSSILWTSLTLLLLAGAVSAGAAETSAADAFARIKTLAGTWTGEGAEQGQTFTVTHEFRVSANASVVMETMNPGTEHEMINMYHLDGDDLVLTHYCAGGNQPTMKLVKAEGDTLEFDFTGGTNLDPATDGYIHGGRLVFVDAGTIRSDWIGYQGGKEAGTTSFTLKRGE